MFRGVEGVTQWRGRPDTTGLDGAFRLGYGNYNDDYRVTQELATRLPVVDVTTTYRSPIPTEANKTVAYEMYEQMKGEVPVWVLLPVSSGPLLWVRARVTRYLVDQPRTTTLMRSDRRSVKVRQIA